MTVEEYVDKVEEGQIDRHDISISTLVETPLWNRQLSRCDTSICLHLLNNRNSIVLNDIEKIMMYYDTIDRSMSHGMPAMVRLFKKICKDGRIWIFVVETENIYEEAAFINSFDEYDNKDINSFGLKPLD